MSGPMNQNEHDIENERHRESCAECTVVWADLERISTEAAALPLLSPSRDLWAGIDARLTTRDDATTIVPLMAVRPSHRRLVSSPALRFAMAASLLVAVTATVTWNVATRDGTQPQAVGIVVNEDEALGQQTSFDASVATMDSEIAQLATLLDERRTSLDPRTVAVLEENMKLIDQAIAESRKALTEDPASRFLATRYTRAYTTKLTLLRGVATMPAGT